MPKYKMTIKLPKTGVCSISGEEGYTEWAHIIGRGTKGEFANDEKLLIELSKSKHEKETSPENRKKIAQFMMNKFGDEWLDYFEKCVRAGGLKMKWISTIEELRNEN
jgi:hypothetical protein